MRHIYMYWMQVKLLFFGCSKLVFWNHWTTLNLNRINVRFRWNSFKSKWILNLLLNVFIHWIAKLVAWLDFVFFFLFFNLKWKFMDRKLNFSEIKLFGFSFRKLCEKISLSRHLFIKYYHVFFWLHKND